MNGSQGRGNSGSRSGSSRGGSPRGGSSRGASSSRPSSRSSSSSSRSSAPRGGGSFSSSRSDDRPRRDSRSDERRPVTRARSDDRPRRDERRDDRPRRDSRSDDRRPASRSRSDERPRRDERRDDRPRRDSRSDDRRPVSRGGSDDRRPATRTRSDDRPRRDSRADDRRPVSRGRADDRPRRDDRRDDRPRRDSRTDDRRPSTRTRSDERPQRPRADSRDRSSAPRQRPVGKPDIRGGRDEELESKFVPVDPDIDIKILPKQVMAELRNISPAAANFVSKHLAAAMYALEDDDAERAYEHAIAARSRAARLGSVREMVGLSAYYSSKWAEALSEFRTFMRLTGDPGFLPLMADCERGLGRPLRALQIARSSQVGSLDASTKIELRIVASGARRDLGQFEAAVATLECPELSSRGHSEAVVRLKYAYAEALLGIGKTVEARDWFVKTALADVDDLTDAADRAVEISE